MAGKIYFPLYLFLPTLALLSSIFVMMLIPYAAKIVENAENVISSRTDDIKLTKFERKMWESVRYSGIEVGAYGYVTKDLKMQALKHISENTINLLLTF